MAYLKPPKSWMAWNVRWTGTSKHWRPGWRSRLTKTATLLPFRSMHGKTITKSGWAVRNCQNCFALSQLLRQEVAVIGFKGNCPWRFAPGSPIEITCHVPRAMAAVKSYSVLLTLGCSSSEVRWPTGELVRTSKDCLNHLREENSSHTELLINLDTLFYI